MEKCQYGCGRRLHIFNSTEQNLIYARTDIGGVYRWNQTDSIWIPLLDHVGWDDWGKTGVDALATDPVEPNRLASRYPLQSSNCIWWI
ncbi:hypothetical protein J2T14_001106 [Paenibacillus harenae]|nr:hypothetical protein [Paenibacillus harenae]